MLQKYSIGKYISTRFEHTERHNKGCHGFRGPWSILTQYWHDMWGTLKNVQTLGVCY